MPSEREPGERPVGREAVRSERLELLEHVQATLEPLMIALGLVFLGLLVVEFSAIELSEAQRRWSGRAQWTIYGFFVVDFVLRFVIAPGKLQFLRTNWLTALSLVIPFLRPLRALRAARALRSIRLVRLLSGLNRGMRVLRQVARGRQFAYVGALTVVVVVLGAAGAWSFERGAAEAPIGSFGDALWWAATLVTTINGEQYVVSLEARVIGVLMRLYAVSVFGYVTASIASYFVGREAAARTGEGDGVEMLREHLVSLQREVALLRRDLAGRREPDVE